MRHRVQTGRRVCRIIVCACGLDSSNGVPRPACRALPRFSLCTERHSADTFERNSTTYVAYVLACTGLGETPSKCRERTSTQPLVRTISSLSRANGTDGPAAKLAFFFSRRAAPDNASSNTALEEEKKLHGVALQVLTAHLEGRRAAREQTNRPRSMTTSPLFFFAGRRSHTVSQSLNPEACGLATSYAAQESS